MATVADACANIQTETERETATTTTATTTTTVQLKLKEETGAEKTVIAADIREEVEIDNVKEEEDGGEGEGEYIGISERELELELQLEQEVEEHEEEEDNEVLYDSLELPQIPAVKTSAVAALEQKLTKTSFEVDVRGENRQKGDDDDNDDDVEEMAKAAASTKIANGEKVAENIEEFKRELQDVVDYCKIQQHQQQEEILQKLQKQREEYLMIDDIPEPIKVLDDIISEFEASSEVKPAIGSLENQSEDDGYMSLSRKNMHREGCEDMSVYNLKLEQKDFQNEILTKNTNANTILNEMSNSIAQDEITINGLGPKKATIGQTTLPKMQRSVATTNPSSYSSLPGCGARPTDNRLRSSLSNGERNILGIDISAVHNAVLRGDLVKVDEPFPNEHPVTIYPGSRDSNLRLKRNQRLLSSVEKHKETCHMLKPHKNTTSNSTSSASSTSTSISDAKPDSKTPVGHPNKTGLEHRVRSASEDDEYSDLSVDQSLSPITEPLLSATQPKSHGHMGLVWEIHFQSEKKKRGSKVRRTAKTQLRPNYKPDVADNSIMSNMEKEWNSNHNKFANMSGKATFVIRKNTNKPLPVKNLFELPIVSQTHQSKESKLVETCLMSEDFARKSTTSLSRDNLKKGKSMECGSNVRQRELEFINANVLTRHSLDNVESKSEGQLTSPRERLSLNLDGQHRSSVKNEGSLPKPHPTSTNSLSPLEVRASRKVHLKRADAQLGLESPRDSRSQGSLEREVGECVAINYSDPSPVYNYKSVTSGCLKNTDYVTDLRTSCSTTPHTDLAPTLEEDEEQYSDFSYSSAPLKQIENNISKLLRGDMPLMQAHLADMKPNANLQRVLEFRPGVHKSESAKEMLLSQNSFGPLPPSPPISNPALFDYDPPLPPSPHDDTSADDEGDNDVPKMFHKNTTTTAVEVHAPGRAYIVEEVPHKSLSAKRHLTDHLPPPPPSTPPMLVEEIAPPAVPPHRGHSLNTIKSWSIDSNFKRRSPRMLTYGNSMTTTPTGPGMGAHVTGGGSMEGNVGVSSGINSMRHLNYGTKRSLKQSPREEHRLQTSFSLPETPIFARGCDIPRTPFRRQPEPPVGGSRTAPRSNTSHSIAMGNSIVGISGGVAAGSAYSMAMCRQHSINHALVSNEMLRLSGAPARGWYPKQRSMRPASTENIDRLTSIRFLDSGTSLQGSTQARKPCTLPPNLTPSFLNKSPREALRRVTSLLIAKKKGNSKERKHKNANSNNAFEHHYELENNETFHKERLPDTRLNGSTPKTVTTKKKSIFKNLWKRSKTVSLDQ